MFPSSRRATIWPSITITAAFALIFLFAGSSMVEAEATGQARKAGTDCEVPDPGSAQPEPLLPDPFTTIDGTRIETRAEWDCRRDEIQMLAEQSVYGERPDPPESVTGSVSTNTITVNVSDQGRSTRFEASVSLPSGSGPFPAVIVYGGFSADTATILDSGAAIVEFDPYTVGQEGTSRSNKQGAFYDIYGSSSNTGLLMAWAWGTSRIIDVIEQSDGSILDTDATGVTGCSRFGKGALVAGAFDERIDLTMPIESGTGGVPAFRSVPQEDGAQPLSSAYEEQPWLGDAFGAYTSDPASLPVDTHEIVGLIAPRALFIMENPHIDWLGAKSGSVGALAGREIYEALGAEDRITYWSDVQDDSHCTARPAWQVPLQQNIRTFLHGDGAYSGEFRIASSKSGDLSAWRDWTTPTLAG